MEEQRSAVAAAAEEQEEEEKPRPSLFPLFPAANTSISQPTPPPLSNQWLCNNSFTTDISVINDAVLATSAAYEDSYRDEEEKEDQPQLSPSPRYELLEEESDEEKGSKRKEKKKRKRSKERGEKCDAFVSTKSKDYYFDSHGDRDNLVYGRIYR